MEQLGIQPQALFLQIVNFTILLVVLTKLLYKPILRMLEKRQKEIAESVALTEKLRIDEEKMTAKREKYLDEAKKEAHLVLEEAKKAGKATEKDIVDQAHKEAQDLLTKASEDAKRMHESLHDAIAKESAELARSMVTRILAGLTSQEQHKIIARNMKSIAKS